MRYKYKIDTDFEDLLQKEEGTKYMIIILCGVQQCSSVIPAIG